jgi:hypothetical protein
MQDCLDIVATQGAYLIPRAGTPVHQPTYDKAFAVALKQHLAAVITEQICRSVMYHGAADEWPMGHTPMEIKEQRIAELKAQEELDSAVSDSSGSDNDNCDKLKLINVMIGSEWAEVASGRPRTSRKQRQVYGLPTPPISVEGSLLSAQKRKRPNMSAEDDEERERLAKTHVGLVPDISKHNAARRKSRKRPRAAKEKDSIWLHRLRVRPKGPST